MKLINKKFTIVLLAVVGLFAQSCLEETVDVSKGKTSALNLQLHNFFAVDGRISTQTRPSIYYFVQEEDGTYTLTLSDSNPSILTPNYYVAHLDSKGVLIGEIKKIAFPTAGGFVADFKRTITAASLNWYQPRNYIVSGPEFIYTARNSQSNQARLCILNPTSDEFKSYSYPNSYTSSGLPLRVFPYGLFKSSDGGYLAITCLREGSFDLVFTLRYDKFTSTGTLEYSYFYLLPKFTEYPFGDSPTLNVGTALTVKEDNGDFYIVNTSPPLSYGEPEYTLLRGFGEEPLCAASYIDFFEPGLSGEFIGGSNFSVEIRFGQGRMQKAHRFLVPLGVTEGAVDSDYTYQDYINVPFEVWDITNNRQLMVSFRDQGRDGEFNLTYENNYDGLAENQSREYLFIHDKTYSNAPDFEIAQQGGQTASQVYFINPTLSYDAEWNPTTLPNFEIMIYNFNWRTQLMKLNESGFSEVKRDFISTETNIESVYQAVPYNDGYALLCNAPQFIGSQFFTEPQQLILLDNNLTQTNAFNIITSENDFQHQMVSNGTTVFYGRVSNSAGINWLSNIQISGKITLSRIKDGTLVERNLDEFIDGNKIRVEHYNITPNQYGGVSLAAWVRPTNNTRDLLFMVFDENLEVVNK